MRYLPVVTYNFCIHFVYIKDQSKVLANFKGVEIRLPSARVMSKFFNEKLPKETDNSCQHIEKQSPI